MCVLACHDIKLFKIWRITPLITKLNFYLSVCRRLRHLLSVARLRLSALIRITAPRYQN